MVKDLRVLLEVYILLVFYYELVLLLSKGLVHLCTVPIMSLSVS